MPKSIQWVMKSVMVLLEKPTDWETMVRQLMYNSNIGSIVGGYDSINPEKLTPEILKKLAKITKDERFNEETIAKKSKGAALIVKCVLAIERIASN